MTLFDSIVLGALQGLTEFLPVSSSGHLVLFETLLGLPVEGRDLLGFDILLHAATALALILCYAELWWRILRSPFNGDLLHRRLLGLLILATLPGAAAGVLLDDWIAANTRSLFAVAVGLFITAMVLLSSRYARGTNQLQTVSVFRALAIGIAQACALVPGVSRSGLTITAGQFSGLSRRDALDFSFLMALPIILGASLKTGLDVLSGEVVLPSLSISVIGFITSFSVSVLAIYSLRKFVSRFTLAWFAWYLLPVAALLLWLSQ